MNNPPQAMLCLCLALTARSALAQPPVRNEAQIYFEAGNQAYDEGQHLLAARAFEEAYRRSPMPEIAFSIAQAYRLAYYSDRDPRWLERALRRYREYLDRVPSGRRRAHAAIFVAALEETVTGRSKAPEESAERGPGEESSTEKTLRWPAVAEPTQLMVTSRTPGAQASIGGGALKKVPFSQHVRPGRHRVRMQAKGFAPAETEWLAVEGRLVAAQFELAPLPAKLEIVGASSGEVAIDGRRVASLPLMSAIAVAPGSRYLAVTERGRVPFERRLRLDRGERTQVRVDSETTTQRKLSYALFAGAGGGVIASGVLLALGLNAEARARTIDEDRTASGISPDEYDEAERALQRRDGFRTASIAAFAGAAALAVTGGLLFYFDVPTAEARERGAGR